LDKALASPKITLFIVTDEGKPKESDDAQRKGHQEDFVKIGKHGCTYEHDDPKPPSIAQKCLKSCHRTLPNDQNTTILISAT
jgi:hypothetical protein